MVDFLQITTHGIAPLKQKLAKLPRRIETNMRVGTTNWIKETMVIAQGMAPKDTGALIASAYGRVGTRGQGIMGFFTNYAIVVHEKHRTQSQFLMRAIQQNTPNVRQKLAMALAGDEREAASSPVPDFPNLGTVIGLNPVAFG